MDGRQENRFEIARTTNNGQPFQLDFSSERVELKEFAKTLNIGDRIRMFCDDGVLVAEKISQTQFKVLYSETMSERSPLIVACLDRACWEDGNEEKPGQN
jgi:hypothetical protein